MSRKNELILKVYLDCFRKFSIESCQEIGYNECKLYDSKRQVIQRTDAPKECL